MTHQSSPRLLALFRLGYDFPCTHQSENDFQGDFVCTYLGDLFRQHNLTIPRALFVNSEGVHGYYDHNRSPHLFHKVLGTIVISRKGQKPITLQRLSQDDFSNMENLFPAPVGKTRRTAGRFA